MNAPKNPAYGWAVRWLFPLRGPLPEDGGSWQFDIRTFRETRSSSIRVWNGLEDTLPDVPAFRYDLLRRRRRALCVEVVLREMDE